MAGTKTLNSDLNLQGKAIINDVPNASGTLLTYNSTSKEVSTRTNSQIISDLGLNTDLTAYVKKAGDTMTGTLSFINTGNALIKKDMSTYVGTSGFARDIIQLVDSTGIKDTMGWQGSVADGVVTFGYGYLGGIAYNTTNAIKWNAAMQVVIGGNFTPSGSYTLEVAGNSLSRGSVNAWGIFNTSSGELQVQRFGVSRIRTNTNSLILSGEQSNGIVYIRPQGDQVATSQVMFNGNNTSQYTDAHNILLGSQTSAGSSLFHTNLTNNTQGYGVWMGHNLQFNGTDFIQPRGTLNSLGFTVNNHKGFSFNIAPASSISGSTVTLTELAKLDTSGIFSANGFLLPELSRSIQRVGSGNNNERVHHKVFNGSFQVSQTGILSFNITTPTSVATMFDVTIKFYAYQTGTFAEFKLGFYRNAAGTIHATAGRAGSLWASENFPTDVVNVGFDTSGKMVINIGEATTVWGNYLSYEIERLETKYSGGAIDWSNGWTSSVITDTTGFTLINVPVERLATRAWALGNLGSNYITTNTAQTGLVGDKETGGNWTFNGTGATSIRTLRPGNVANNSIGYGFDTITHYLGLADANTFALGINPNLTENNRKFWVDTVNNTFSIRPNGGSMLSSRDIAGFTITTPTNSSRAEMILRHVWSANNQTFGIGGVSSPTAGSMSQWGMFKWLNDRTTNGNDGFFGWTGNTDVLTATSLAGTGTRMVVALAGGQLTTQAIPTSTTYTAGAGLTLTGTQFSLPVIQTGTGNAVTGVTQTATGISVDKGSNFALSTDLNNYISKAVLSGRAIADANSAVGVDFFYTGGSNRPSGSVDGALLNMTFDNSLWNTQMYSDWRTNEWYVRSKSDGNWGNWQKIYHDGNFNPSAFVTTSRTITIDGVTQDLSANRSWTTNNTVTRLRGGGSFVSGDITISAGANTTVSQSGQTITIASTDTNTTYSAGTGLTLTGTTFSVNYGTTAGTAAQGNDPRINNGQTAFNWGNHTGLYLPLTGGTLTGRLDINSTNGVGSFRSNAASNNYLTWNRHDGSGALAYIGSDGGGANGGGIGYNFAIRNPTGDIQLVADSGLVTYNGNEVATKVWADGKFVTLNTIQTINANKIFAGATGNDYNNSAIMINGNGTNLYPSIGFHQPGIVGATVSVRNDSNLYFNNNIIYHAGNLNISNFVTVTGAAQTITSPKTFNTNVTVTGATTTNNIIDAGGGWLLGNDINGGEYGLFNQSNTNELIAGVETEFYVYGCEYNTFNGIAINRGTKNVNIGGAAENNKLNVNGAVEASGFVSNSVPQSNTLAWTTDGGTIDLSSSTGKITQQYILEANASGFVPTFANNVDLVSIYYRPGGSSANSKIFLPKNARSGQEVNIMNNSNYETIVCNENTPLDILGIAPGDALRLIFVLDSFPVGQVAEDRVGDGSWALVNHSKDLRMFS